MTLKIKPLQRILLLQRRKEDSTIKYLRRMNNLYTTRQAAAKFKQKPVQNESSLKTFLRLVGVLPIERPRKLYISK